jgi:eukaryotic-like serine/threonine-protein kinase
MGESIPSEGDPLVGTVLGRYQILRVVGTGGMGVVYEATHQDLGRRAAIKTLHDHYARAPDVRQRFLREGQAASRVRHPNIVDVYDVGIEGSCPYLVMEFLDGVDLGHYLAVEGVLSPQRACDLLLPVVSALSAAHDLDVVHRDLKPENVFLSEERNGITPKVLDFGISKVINRDDAESLTGTGAFLGTPHYMSPEQAQGAKRLDHRSDQYSLGVMLYRCVTGRKPVEELSLYALIQRIVRGDFPPPRQLNPELPKEFEAVILRAMAREPDARFPNTRALGSALLDFASENVRSQYAREFRVDALSETAIDPPRAASQPAPADASAPLDTTLGASVHRREGAGASRSTRRGLGLAALALAAAIAVAYRWRGAPTPDPPSSPTAAAASPGAGPSPSPSLAVEPPAPSPTQPVEALVPSPSESAPKPLASEKKPAPTAPPKKSSSGRPPPADRPSLAPR